MNKEREETLQYVLNQFQMGFDPQFMVTYHYKHPSEHGWRTLEYVKDGTTRWGFKTQKNIWEEVPSYNYYERRRRCQDSIAEDASQVKNVILKRFWGIKRPNQKWKYKLPPMLFFHELGKTKLKYHTHLLLPSLPDKFNTIESLQSEWNGYIRRSRECFSRWKTIHVMKITDPTLIANYLVKEVSSHQHSLDYYNSLFIHEV